MKLIFQLVIFFLCILFVQSSNATTGIGSVGYLWGAVVVLIGLIGVLFLLVKFLKKVKKDTMKHDKPEDQ